MMLPRIWSWTRDRLASAVSRALGRRRIGPPRGLGERGERVAELTLRGCGMRILARNYGTSQGEVDLIARDGDVVVFVEVKARRRGVPAEAVGAEKRRRLTLAALHYLKTYGLLERPCRFDVVAIVWRDDREAPEVEHIRSAFEAVGRGQMFR